MSNTYNIPSVSAEETTEILTVLYSTAIREGTLPLVPSVSLWGPMGVGKSTLVRELARRLTLETGRKTVVTDIRLLLFNPIDLRGVPVPDAEKKFTNWLMPKIFDMDDSPHVINILLLDELSAAPPSMQASAYQISLDKRIGEFKLPENCIVICSGNRTTDRSVAFRMPKALANRLMHFEIRAEFDSWYEWAVREGIDERVIGYLAFDNSRLSVEAGVEELAFPTPRSWEFVSRLLQTTGRPPEEIHSLIAGCVGVSTAGEFESWCKVYEELPSTKDILSGKHTVPVKGTDVLYALVSSLIVYVSGHSETITAAQLDNICRYASRLPADFAALFFRGLIRIEGMNLKLARITAFHNWMKKNKRFL